MLFIASCTTKPSSPVMEAVVADTLLYAAAGAKAEGIECRAIVSRQRIEITFARQHAAGDGDREPGGRDYHDQYGRDVARDRWELTTREGSRSTPVDVRTNGIYTTLVFEPVHSRQLFQDTGLRGDVDESYSLSVSGVGEGEVIHLTAHPVSHQESIEQFGLAAGTFPFMIQVPDDFTMSQQQHLEQVVWNRQEHAVQVSGNEILVDGFWCKVQACHRKDTLYVDLRMVNQSSVAVRFDLRELRIMQGDNVIQPVRGDSVSATSILIPDGRRNQFQLKFPARAENCMLDLRSLVFAQKKTIPVFYMPLALQKRDI